LGKRGQAPILEVGTKKFLDLRVGFLGSATCKFFNLRGVRIRTRPIML